MKVEELHIGQEVYFLNGWEIFPEKVTIGGIYGNKTCSLVERSYQQYPVDQFYPTLLACLPVVEERVVTKLKELASEKRELNRRIKLLEKQVREENAQPEFTKKNKS
jgi:hypothetical protein